MLHKLDSIKNMLTVMLLGVVLMSCDAPRCASDAAGTQSSEEQKNSNGKIIVITGEAMPPNRFDQMVAYQKQAIKDKGISKEVVFVRVHTVKSQADYEAEVSGMQQRTAQFTKAVLEEIEKNKWDTKKNDFVLLGRMGQGLVVLGAAEELRKSIHVTKIIALGAPLLGFDFYNAPYHTNHGAIGKLIADLCYATTPKGSTLDDDLTPGSDYLKKRLAFIESQSGEQDIKIYIIDACARNLCPTPSAATKKDDEVVDKLFERLAQRIRNKNHKAHASKKPRDLPGVKEYMYLWEFLRKSNKYRQYAVFKKLNGGKEHSGFLSVESQRGGNIANPRIRRASFDSYSGTLFIPYKELGKLESYNVCFNEKEYTLTNPKLYDKLLEFVLEE